MQDPWPYRPPRKIARICGTDSSESSPLALVRNVQRTPPPKVYSSPESGKFNEVKELSSYTEVSPRCFGRNDEEKENMMRHSLSGNFPSVTLFKEFQNAAMEVIVLIPLLHYLVLSSNFFTFFLISDFLLEHAICINHE